jgi:hypothetical protein
MKQSGSSILRPTSPVLGLSPMGPLRRTQAPIGSSASRSFEHEPSETRAPAHHNVLSDKTKAKIACQALEVFAQVFVCFIQHCSHFVF